MKVARNKVLLSISFLFWYGILFSNDNKVVKFTENKGQWNSNILFQLKMNNGSMFLEQNRITYHFIHEDDLEKLHGHKHEEENSNKENQNSKKYKHKGHSHSNVSRPSTLDTFPIRHHAFYVNFKNANASANINTEKSFSHYANYFIGNNPKQWASNVQSHNEITYQNLYNGIDLQFGEQNQRLKYQFLLAAQADAANIQLEFEGVEKIYLNNGRLIYETSVNKIEELKPYSYQIINGKQKEIASAFVLNGNVVSFSFPNGYDKNLPLVIDPVLIFSSYTGSQADNFGFTATYDDAGDLYAGGIARGAGYPTTAGAFQSTFAGGIIQGNFELGFNADISISRFNSAGNTLLFSTYIGGSINEQPHSLVVDSDTNLIILGRTNSTDYPVSQNGYDITYNGEFDIILTKISKDGTNLLGSTYVGGSGADGINIFVDPFSIGSLKYNYADDSRSEVIVDTQNNVYVAACSKSFDFPTSTNAFQRNLGGNQDAVIFKMNANLSALLWSTYLGGASDEAAYSLVFDSVGNIYTCGGTNSTNFPVTPNANVTTYRGGLADGFISKISNNGNTLLNSTYLGTTAYDQCFFIQLDDNQNVYLFGQTEGNIPSSTGTYSNANSGQFVVGLGPDLSGVRFSTTIGTGKGTPDISPTAFLVDNCRNIYLSGWGSQIIGGATISTTGLPVTPDAFQATTDGGDFYFMVLSENASQLLYATYFGGTQSTEHVDGGTSRFDKNGVIYQAVCAGCGGYNDFPTTPGVVSNTNNSQIPQRNCNVGVIKFQITFNDVDVNITSNVVKGCSPLTVNFDANGFQTDSYEWNFGNGQTSTLPNPSITYSTPGTYIVSLFGRNTSCPGLNLIDSSFVTIIVTNDSVTADFNYTVAGDCDSNVVFFNSITSNATAYSWDFGDGNFSTLQNPIHSYNAPGSFAVTFIAYNDTACIPTDTITKTVEVVVGFRNNIVFSNDTVCEGATISFSNTHYETNNNASFNWNFGNGEVSTLNNSDILFNVPGIYTVTLITTDSSYCNITDTTSVTIVVTPNNVIADFSIEPEYELFEEITFQNLSQNAVRYVWEFGDGETSVETNPVHQYNSDGIFSPCLTAYNQVGCFDTICKQLRILFVGIVDVANAFSPNADGQNDIIYVKGYGIEELEFKIYNRWGQLIFESNDITIGWDGTFKGVPQEAEVYVYTLKAKFKDGVETNLRKGNITLLR
jgi:gliding motility-associated-like protein